jgi:hypothetical protein
VQILQISSSLLSKYPTVQERLLWLVFIPHVLLVIFIFLFADNIARIGGVKHMGIRTLVAVAAYVTIIFTGWYGTYIVPWFINIWYMVLALAIIGFVVSRFLHPARAKEFMALGKVVGEKFGEKEKVRKKLEHERDTLKRMIQQVNAMPTRTAEGQQAKEMQLVQLKARLAEIEQELSEA